MNILEELWYGNLSLHDRSIGANSEYARALNRAVAEGKKLSGEIQKEVADLLDAEQEICRIAERDAFVLGFQLAVQIMVASLANPSAK